MFTVCPDSQMCRFQISHILFVSFRIDWDLHPISPSESPQKLRQRWADQLRSSSSAPPSVLYSSQGLPLYTPSMLHQIYNWCCAPISCCVNPEIVFWSQFVDVDESFFFWKRQNVINISQRKLWDDFLWECMEAHRGHTCKYFLFLYLNTTRYLEIMRFYQEKTILSDWASFTKSQHCSSLAMILSNSLADAGWCENELVWKGRSVFPAFEWNILWHIDRCAIPRFHLHTANLSHLRNRIIKKKKPTLLSPDNRPINCYLRMKPFCYLEIKGCLQEWPLLVSVVMCVCISLNDWMRFRRV